MEYERSLAPSDEDSKHLIDTYHRQLITSVSRMNIDSVTVGGYSRSRCSGNCASVVSSNCALVSTLKNSTAWVDLACRPMLLRR